MKQDKNSIHRILVIDSDPMLAELVSFHFRGEAEVFCVETFEELLSFDVEDLSLIIIDPRTDNNSGREMVELCRGNFEKRIPILLISTPTSHNETLKCLTSGADDFISRPFEVTSLVNRIRKFLGR